jgi:hypothetical protein
MAKAETGGKWLISAVYVNAQGSEIPRASIKGVEWADSYVQNWHYSHLGEALQTALWDAKERAFPARRKRRPWTTQRRADGTHNG